MVAPSTLTFDEVELPTTVLPADPAGSESSLPILGNGGGRVVSESEAALLGTPDAWPRRTSMLPYRNQWRYTRDTPLRRHHVATLDNGVLRATVLLDLGGRLWTLTDLASDTELLFQPDSIRIANLALRNAWFSGGVEWNLGTTGHWGLTCEPVNAGVVHGPDGGPVLRLWAYERLLGLVWRVDLWLPAGSRRLFSHVALGNPHDETIPLYWWSNAAVPLRAGGRVLCDAGSAFHFAGDAPLAEVGIPGGSAARDRPDLAPASADYFFRVRARVPWIASVDAGGRGLGHASTPELPGRKAFYWGEGSGGHTWQRWLNGSGRYVEVQAGLASTQLEHLALPPGGRRAWTEAWGPVDIGAASAEAWSTAVDAAAHAVLDDCDLTGADAVLAGLEDAPPVVVRDVDGWGGLAVSMGDLPAAPGTPFRHLDAEQRDWLAVAGGEVVPASLEFSAVSGRGWERLLQESPTSWLADLHRGNVHLSLDDPEAARAAWQASADAHPNPLALRGLAHLEPDAARRRELLGRAHALAPRNAELTLEYLDALASCGEWVRTLDVIKRLVSEVRSLPRTALLEARARLGTGDVAGARTILERPLVLPDLREGDRTLDLLWGDLQGALGTSEPLPAHYDFRMVTTTS